MNTNANAVNRSLTSPLASTACTMSAKPPSTSDEAPAQWLRRLWERMTALYGHAWVSVHGTSPQASEDSSLTIHGETWAKVLAGLSGAQLARGLEACMVSGGEFPPSAPRFRAMCFQLPNLATVRIQFLHAARGGDKATGPFARLVYQFLDYERYRYGDKKASDKALQEAYGLACEHIMRGESYPREPVAAITDAPVKHRELSEEELAAARERCRANAEKAFADMRRVLEIPDEESN